MMSQSCPIKQAVLLVGGLGTRLRPLTYRMPKALLPLLNRPLISYELELLGRAGIEDVTLALAYQAEALQQALGDGSPWGITLRYCEEPSPLDTAGAIGNVREHLKGDFLALNGDLVLDLDVGALVRAHLEAEADVTILLRKVDDITPFGLIQRDDSGVIVAFKEKVAEDETGQNTVNAGLYVMSPRVLEAIPPGEPYSNEHQLFPRLLAEGARLLGYLPERQGYWADVGRAETYLATNRALLDGAIEWAQPAVESPVSPYLVQQPICVGANCNITGQLGPYTTIGHNCQVEKAATLQDCVVMDDVHVGSGALVRSAIVAPGAHVPPGAQITDGVFDSND